MMILLMNLLTLAPSPADASLSLRREAVVSRDRVYLSDVLAPSSYRLLKSRGIGNLALESSPDYDRRRTLLRSRVTDALQEARPNLKVYWSGPSSVMLKRRGNPFSEQDLETAVTDWVLSRELGMDGQLNVENISYPKFQTVPMGEISYQIRARAMRTMVGRFGLYVDVMADGMKFKTIAVHVQTSMETMIARLKTDLSRGTPIGENDIEWEYSRLERMGHAPISADEMSGLRARTQLRAGMVLNSRNVERIPLVERNQTVQVTVHRSNLRISLKALAMQSGGEGELIRLKNTDSGQVMSGTVQADGTVLLEM